VNSLKARKILDNIKTANINISPLFDESEIIDRHDDYSKCTNKNYDTKYREHAFNPVTIEYDGRKELIQYNYCSDPFCPNYAEPLEMLISRKSRSVKNYMFVGSKDSSLIRCNIMKHVGLNSRVDNNSSTLMSNWSIAEEIKRLVVLNRVVDEQVEYVFHEETCNEISTPFEKVNSFIKYGKTPAGSPRYKCNVCGKTTAIKPSTKSNMTYYQQRSDVTVDVFKDILSRIPVRQICERNNISATTFYAKIDFIYQKCLAFLERHEGKLSNVNFDDLYIASDSFMYSLNNIRRNGKGGSKQSRQEKAQANEAITYMISSGDVRSAYIFRADLCYDTFIDLEDIEKDTQTYHCDHTFAYLRKNERIRHFSYAPQIPTTLDSENQSDYLDKRLFFDARDNFVKGLHTQQSYTQIAHMNLLKNTLHANRFVFVSDNDNSIKQSIFKVFATEFKESNAFYFTSQFDKTLERQDAFKESAKSRNELDKWFQGTGMTANGIYEKAIAKIESDLFNHDFEKHKIVNGKTIASSGNNLYQHPLPAIDEGRRFINLISPKGHLAPDELAEMIVHANTRTVDNFFQELRRHLNLLERPLLGARGGGKTYIYANYNPKYAQQLITIYRTYYNFLKPRKYYNKDKRNITPAMRIGIADKVFTIRDIVYFY